MEIKILCHCGTKFKFDWDTQRDGMPSRINCPGCAADVTLEAREIIRQQAGPVSPSPTVLPVGVPIQTSPPPLPVPPPPPAITRIASVPPPPLPRPVQPRLVRADAEDSSKTKLVVVSVLVLVLVVGGFAAWKIGSKVYSGVQAVREMASIVNDAGSAAKEFNLQADDSVILYVNHSNHLEVAQACTEYWKSTLNKNLTVLPEPDDDEGHPGDYPLSPAYHGYVRVMGPLEWPEAQYEGLSKFLSTRLNTLVFEERDVDFSGAFHFGVYDKGERKFHARMDIVGNDFEEKVTVENEAWALQHGFKPGEEGFQAFDIGDADAITKRLGMKLWDEGEDAPKRLVLRETP